MRRILGIDPGTALLGWGVIDVDEKRKNNLVAYGVIVTKSTAPMPERLVIIYDQLNAIFETYHPDECIVEELFFNNNAKTAISVGQARGVVLLVAQLFHVSIFEYTALQVKSALSGYGRADKKQMQTLVKIILHMKETPKPDDAADALAIAIAHTQYMRTDSWYNKIKLS